LSVERGEYAGHGGGDPGFDEADGAGDVEPTRLAVPEQALDF
jgi:hypothetical protein